VQRKKVTSSDTVLGFLSTISNRQRSTRTNDACRLAMADYSPSPATLSSYCRHRRPHTPAVAVESMHLGARLHSKIDVNWLASLTPIHQRGVVLTRVDPLPSKWPHSWIFSALTMVTHPLIFEPK